MVELLKADRSFSNESNGKEMFGSLATNGVVECYFPTEASFNRNGTRLSLALAEIPAEYVAFNDAKHDYNQGPFPCVVESKQRALMFAGAREMLEALHFIARETLIDSPVYNIAMAAIAKAEGKPT